MRKVYNGEIYLYNFGESDSCLYSGLRPVLSLVNMKGNNFMFSPLSASLKRSDLKTHLLLEKANNKFLSYDSIVITEQIFTREKNKNIVKKLGKINKQCENQVRRAIEVSIGYNNSFTEIACQSKASPHRGDIVKYTRNGNNQFGVILQNDKGNEFSPLTILIDASEAQRDSEYLGIKDNILCYKCWDLNYKIINTISKRDIVEVVERVDATTLKFLTKIIRDMFYATIV